ncbi:MAG: SWIM zinc finger family protein [Cyanobacteria bacterium P01_A01_bin.135]
MTYLPSNAPAPASPEDQEWWVQRWIDLLNAYRFKKRLERGRLYAREGNILSLEFRGSKVHAQVQGTASEPYKVTISIESFSQDDWRYIINSMAQKAVYSAKLLAGIMPDDIEDVFTSNGLSLFPFSLSDVRSRCSCPDPKNPCKHIAAVYYQLGDSFREDPFILFQLRGRTKKDILQALRDKRSGPTASQTKAAAKNAPQVDSLDTFWAYDQPLDPSLVVITPAGGQAVLDLLGKLPLSSSDAQTVRQYLDTIYQTVSQAAMMEALGGGTE